MAKTVNPLGETLTVSSNLTARSKASLNVIDVIYFYWRCGGMGDTLDLDSGACNGRGGSSPSIFIISPGGGTGRHAALKMRSSLTGVQVRCLSGVLHKESSGLFVKDDIFLR
jgi:hypothetical protein